jgi:hypothetical protein
MSTRHVIKTQILQEVLNYLGTKPYQEVAALVTAIQSDAVLDAAAIVASEISSDSVTSTDQAVS